MANRPILASSCARAATAAEARFRIDAKVPEHWRSARVIALDDAAAGAVDRVPNQQWRARFYSIRTGPAPQQRGDGAGNVLLRDRSGSDVLLADELIDADLAVMVATSDRAALPAAAIAAACAGLGIMTAGLVLGSGDEAGSAAYALRPYARVMLITADEDDVSAILQALRA